MIVSFALPLITVWLRVRVLPGPPRSPNRSSDADVSRAQTGENGAQITGIAPFASSNGNSLESRGLSYPRSVNKS
jgi:hypothetical protein